MFALSTFSIFTVVVLNTALMLSLGLYLLYGHRNDAPPLR